MEGKDSPQRMFYLIFYLDQNLRFCMPVSSDYLLFDLDEKEKKKKNTSVFRLTLTGVTEDLIK